MRSPDVIRAEIHAKQAQLALLSTELREATRAQSVAPRPTIGLAVKGGR